MCCIYCHRRPLEEGSPTAICEVKMEHFHEIKESYESIYPNRHCVKNNECPFALSGTDQNLCAVFREQ